jgi:hypothetical protein
MTDNWGITGYPAESRHNIFVPAMIAEWVPYLLRRPAQCQASECWTTAG